ncbi:MAG: hypothetical protein QF388_06950, partial [Acidimicrobiales bacterium]|nr:hypothetical protein [Acidimicrobiales bacterium]
MSSRLEIEITSKVDESLHTWRAVGAKEPKGVIKTVLLPTGSEIGQTFRVEAEFLLDGIEIISVFPPKAKREEPQLLEIIGSGNNDGSVTTSLVAKRKRKKSGGKQRASQNSDKARRNNQERKKTRITSKTKPKRKSRTFKPPRGKRLKPKRRNRNDFLDSLPVLHRPLARELMRGSIPKLRDTLKTMDLPTGFNEPILDYAEKLVIKLKAAEWLDRAEAVDKTSDTIDLQDFRSVVAASQSSAKSSEALVLKEKLELALKKRIEREHEDWLKIIQSALEEGKLVRALNFSSRPPKAGAQLPEELALELARQAGEALNSETPTNRWAIVAEAIAFSPIRLKVHPVSL